MELTYQQVRDILPRAKKQDIIDFVGDFNKFSWLHKMTKVKEIAHFIAQIGHESLQLLYKTEIDSGAYLEGRLDLGNTEPGDGSRFKGRGWLMCTGRYNYAEFTKWYNKNFKDQEDFVKNPTRISDEHELSFIVSVWFWQNKKIRPVALANNVKAVTKKVNGGTNGYAERKAYTKQALKVLSQVA